MMAHRLHIFNENSSCTISLSCIPISLISVVYIQNREDFQQHVINCTEKTVLLNFWTGWSDSCGTMSTTFDWLRYFLDKGHSIACADWDRQRWLADQLRVYGVPTLLVFDQGRVKLTLLGVILPDVLLTCLSNLK